MPSRLRFPNLMDGNVIIPLGEFMDVILRIFVSEILSRNGLDMASVFKADRYGLGRFSCSALWGIPP